MVSRESTPLWKWWFSRRSKKASVRASEFNQPPTQSPPIFGCGGLFFVHTFSRGPQRARDGLNAEDVMTKKPAVRRGLAGRVFGQLRAHEWFRTAPVLRASGLRVCRLVKLFRYFNDGLLVGKIAVFRSDICPVLETCFDVFDVRIRHLD